MSTRRGIDSHNGQVVIGGIAESSKHAWYRDKEPLHPWQGNARPNYTGWNEDGKYAWVKAPTFFGGTVAVGPLANVLGMLAAGHEGTRQHMDTVLGLCQKLGGSTLRPQEMPSALGGVLGRALRCGVMKVALADQWQALVDDIGRGDYVA
ncbi:nickel-dependent hydrogenase large subunit, partial [Plesiomonas shigelloides]